MKKTWKYAISGAEHTPMTAPLVLEGDLYELMEKARTCGYDALEFHTRENYDFDLDRIAALRETGKGDICTLATGRLYTQGGCCLLGDTQQSVDGAMNGMQTYIDKAAALGCDVVLGLAKGDVKPGEDRGEVMARLAGRLQVLSDYAAQRKVRILLEVINHYETNTLNTAEEIMTFFEQYGLSNCYVHLDTFHMGIEEFDPCAAIRRCGKRLGYLHIADNSRRYPGSGQFDFARILSALAEIGYGGYVSLECFPEPDRDTTARKTIEHLRDCEKRAGIQ